LVVVLLFLAILLGGIAVLASFVTLSQRSGSAQRNTSSAQQSALFGLNVALGELQSAAGPDQRVTAPATILGNSTYTGNLQPVAGQAAWTGVWKSNTGTAPNGDPAQFNPATPDTKAFVGWLVSATDAGGNFTIPTALLAPTSNSTLTANQTKTLFTSNGTAYIQAGKVQIDDVPGGKRYFAFAVEDEGVKANLSWSETPASTANNTTERAQASRLSAAPGPDYAALNGTNGPFTSLTYPLTIANTPFLSSAIAPMRDPADLQVSMNATATWLKDQRANITWGSKGVLCDVKKGGLRRDLSLAFEMDGTAEAEAATKFNTQTSEFVGNGDALSAPQKPAGLPVNERFLWRDFNGSGTPFSGNITAGLNAHGIPLRLRGPNWWALRDYANLYKRVSATGGVYTMAARAYFPNRSSEGSVLSDYLNGTGTGETWDVETGTNTSPNKYLYRPARANYAPVNLGTSILVSILAKNVSGTAPNQTADLAIALDPLFYFWNPYNRKISCENIAVVLAASLPGRAVFDVKTTGNSTTSYDLALGTLLANNAVNGVNVNGWAYSKLVFLIRGPFVLEPGEVVIASPIANGGAGTGEAVLGYATNNTSGIIMTKLGAASPFPPITVRLDDQVSFAFLRTDNVYYGTNNLGNYAQGTIRHEMDTFLPKGTVTPQSLSANMTLLGEQTQHNLQVLWAYNSANFIEDQYTSPAGAANAAASGIPKVRTETASNLVDTKVIFGASSLLIKPASPGGLGTPKPHEMFARFNPAPMLMMRDYYAVCYPNQIYRHVTANSAFSVLNSSGIDFSGAARNTFWGLSYQSTGSISAPVSNIPSSPLFSLASFSDANLSVMGTDPFHAVGNSWSSPLIPPSAAYGNVNVVNGTDTGQDFSWLINDALFDRYYLSGIAPAFTIGSGGYSASGTLTNTLTCFFSANYTSALANPVLRPYLPPGTSVAQAVAALDPNDPQYASPMIYDGYKKTGAYSLIAGAFNVNSTSVAAWTAFLRANRNLAVGYAQGTGSDSASGSPFPGSSSPSAPGSGSVDPKPQWSGFARLTDSQISALATKIIAQVKLRGPFMSLSDFINHKMGAVDNNRSYTGALQAALDLEAAPGGSGINADSRAASGGTAPGYPASAFAGTPVLGTGTQVTTGIPGDITQADLLLPLAPRLAARSDTFRIRSYGEVRSTDGTRVISQATCEAVVQRVPEYMDPVTDAANNEPWDEGAGLNQTNESLGRRFKVVSFRWLNPNEI
jgi:hypothetical protein